MHCIFYLFCHLLFPCWLLNHCPHGDFSGILDKWLTFKVIMVIDGCGISCENAFRWMSLDHTDDKPTLVQVLTASAIKLLPEPVLTKLYRMCYNIPIYIYISKIHISNIFGPSKAQGSMWCFLLSPTFTCVSSGELYCIAMETNVRRKFIGGTSRSELVSTATSRHSQFWPLDSSGELSIETRPDSWCKSVKIETIHCM